MVLDNNFEMDIKITPELLGMQRQQARAESNELKAKPSNMARRIHGAYTSPSYKVLPIRNFARLHTRPHTLTYARMHCQRVAVGSIERAMQERLSSLHAAAGCCAHRVQVQGLHFSCGLRPSGDQPPLEGRAAS